MPQVYTDTPLKSAPSAQAGVSVTPNGSAWAYSSWVQVAASISAAWVVAGFSIKPPTGVGDSSYDVEVGVGPTSGSVTTIGARRGIEENQEFGGASVLRFRIPVDNAPAGSNVWVRLRKSDTNTSAWQIALRYWEKPIVGNLVTTSAVPTVYPSGSVTSVTPSGSAWVYSSWVEVIASAADALAIDQIAFYTDQSVQFEIQIGVGTAGNETAVATLKGGTTGGVFLTGPHEYLVWPIVSVASGSRVAIRLRIGTTSTAAWLFGLGAYLGASDIDDVVGTGILQWSPEGAAATTIAAPGTGWGNSSAWTQFEASLSEDRLLAAVVVHDPTVPCEIDIGVGSAGNEVVVSTVRGMSNRGLNNVIYLEYPLAFSAGDRVACRVRSGTGSPSPGIALGWTTDTDFAQATTRGIAVWPPAQDAISVTTSGTPWADSSRGELTAGESFETRIVWLVFTGSTGAEDVEIDVDVGPSGSEETLLTYRFYNGAWTTHGLLLPVGFVVPANTRVTWKMRWDGGSGTCRLSALYLQHDLNPSDEPATLPAFPTGYRIIARVDLGHVDSAGAAETTSYGAQPIWDAEGKLVLPHVVSLGFYERACSGLYGDLPIGSARVHLADLPDLRTALMRFRGWLDSAEQYGLLSIVGSIWMISEADWRLQRAWLPVFTGPVAKYGLPSPFGFTLELKDWWERILTDPFPLRTLGEDFAGAPGATRDLYGQLVVGRHSDEASATAAPTPATETVSGTHQDGGSGDWIAGFGPGAGTAPSSFAAVEQTSSGNLDTGVWPSDEVVVMVAPVNGGVVGEPTPRVPGDQDVTITMNGSAVLATCADTGDDAYRFFFGYRATNKIAWTQYQDTTDPVTGVVCTDMPAPGVTPETSNITAGFSTAQVTDIWYGQRVAKMPDGLTAASVEFLAINAPFPRTRRIVTAAIAGAEAYYDYWHLPGQPASFRYLVPAGQINGSGDVYGDSDLSFATAQPVTGTPTPMGRVKGDVIGKFLSLDGAEYVAASFAAHPINPTDFQGMYFRDADGAVTPVDGVGGNPAFGTDIFAPGQSGFTTKWGSTPYRTGLTGQRHFVCYFLGPWGDRLNGFDALGAPVDPYEVFINVAAGVEDVGDATGAGVTDGHDQLAWVMDNYTLPEVAHSLNGGGNWATAVPTWPDGRDKRDADSFATTAAEAAFEIPGGAARSFIIRTPETMGTVLKRIVQGLDAQLFQNINGAFALALLPPTSSEDNSTLVDHVNDVGEALEIEDDEQELFNVLPYQLDYDAAAGSYREVDETSDSESIAKYRRRTAPSGTFDLWTVPSTTVALQIMDRARQRHRKPVRRVTYQRDISGVSLDLGTRYLLTHPMGATASGYTSRRMQVQKVRFDLDNDRMQVWSYDRDWIGRDLTSWETEEIMASRWGGGSRHDSCVTVSARVKPFNWQQIRINWAQWPTGVPAIARVLLGTAAGTATPYVADSTDLATAVATGTVVSSATPAYQDIELYDGVGAKPTGTVLYELILTLGGGAADTDVNAAWWIEGRPGEA